MTTRCWGGLVGGTLSAGSCDVSAVSPVVAQQGIKYARTDKKGIGQSDGVFHRPQVFEFVNLLVLNQGSGAAGFGQSKSKKGGRVPPFCTADRMIGQTMTAEASPTKSVRQHAITYTATFPDAKFHPAISSPAMFPS